MSWLGDIGKRFSNNPINSLMDPMEALGLNPHQVIPGLKGPGEALGMQGISGSAEMPVQQTGRRALPGQAVARGTQMGSQQMQADALRTGPVFGGR